jgi:hypothetical protein
VSTELSEQLAGLSRSVERLVIVASALDAESVPLYAVGGLALGMASLADQVLIRGLEVHAAVESARTDLHRGAGMASPEVVAYMSALLDGERAPGPEVGRWS